MCWYGSKMWSQNPANRISRPFHLKNIKNGWPTPKAFHDAATPHSLR